MGGKTQTYTGLQAQAIFAEVDNLYSKELLRIFALTKTINIPNFTRSMLLASQKYYSAEKFKALGVSSEITSIARSITKDGVTTFLRETTGDSRVYLLYFSTEDINGIPLVLNAFSIKDHLEETYNVDASRMDLYEYTYTFNISYNHTQYTWATGLTGPDTATVNCYTHAYELFPGSWYYLVNDNISSLNKVTMGELDGSLNPTGFEIELEIPEDNRSFYVCRHLNKPAGVYELADPTHFFKDDIISEATNWTFLMLPIKDEGEMVENPGYVKALLNDLGLGNGALEESLDNSDIKRALISHSTDFTDEDFQDEINEIYGPSGNRNEVTLFTENYDIKYFNQPPMSNPPGYCISIDSFRFSVDGKNIAMLPLEVLRMETIDVKYQHIRKTLRIWANTVVTVEMAWYQSGFFKILFLIIAIYLTATTGEAIYLMMAVGAPAGITLITDLFGEEVANIVILAITIYRMDIEFGVNLETFATMAGVANQISQVFFIYEQKGIQKDITYTQKQEETAREAIAEIKKETLYIPMDSYSMYYDSMYSIAEEAYTTVYSTAYNFDIMLKPKLGV